MKIPKSILSSTTADNSSIALAGDNYGTISLNTGLANEQLIQLQKSIQNIQNTISESGDTKVRDEIDEVLNNQIDSYIKFIEDNKPKTALGQFEELLKHIKVGTSGKIIFRIKANIGICHYFLGNDEKAADYLLEAYIEQPTEPKAIANRVLALMLKRRAEEAYEFGKQELSKDSTNETLAGYLIQVSRLMPLITNPLADIPKTLRNKPAIVIGQIHYLQHRGKNGDWWKIAHSGFKSHPNNKELKHYAAQATAEEVLSSPDIEKSFSATEEQFLKLSLASEVLFETWKLRCNSEGPMRDEDQINGINLLNIFYFLHNKTRFREVLSDAIDKSENDSIYLQSLAQYAIQFQEVELAENAIKNIKHLAGSEFICFEIAQVKGDHNYLSKVPDHDIQKFPLRDRSVYKIVSELSKFSTNKTIPSIEELESLLQIENNGIRELLLISHAANIYNHSAFSELSYEKAKAELKHNSHVTSKFMLAREAGFRKDWITVIECLEGSISLHSDSDELRQLATAYANQTPVLLPAIKFFKDVIKKNIAIPHFNILYGVALYNQGALPEAIKILVIEFEKNPKDLYTLICLINSYIRIDAQEKIKELLSIIDPYILEGHAIHQMQLAHLLKKYDHTSLAIEFGYSVLSKNSNLEKVASMYFGLIMMGAGSELIPASDIVKNGYCIKLQNKTGTVFEFLLDDNLTSHLPIIEKTHPLIQSSIGLSLNSTFEQIRSGYPSIIWNVVEIKHKYLHALHSIMETFETKFPNSKSIFKIELSEEDNIEEILKTIKFQSEQKELTLSKYSEYRMPLAMMARFLGKDHTTIIVAEELIQNKSKIYTNSGSEAEFNSAIQVIAESKFNTVILDTYSAWHLALLDLLPVFKKLFNKIVISQSTIDDVSSLLADTDSFFENEKMSIGWKNGEYQRYMMTLEEHHQREDFIRSQRKKLLENCDIEIIELDVIPNELVSEVIKHAGIKFWEPAILANQPNRLLISEDAFYRQWSTQGFDLRNSTWIDPVLRHAFKESLISLDQLSNYLVHFAHWNHSHIFLTNELLLKTLELDKSEKLYGFGSLCKYIGNDGCETTSHLSFTEALLNEIWSNTSMAQPIKVKSTELILDNLLKFVTNKAQIIIVLCQSSSGDMCECIIDWRERNGIDDDEMTRAYSQIFENGCD